MAGDAVAVGDAVPLRKARPQDEPLDPPEGWAAWMLALRRRNRWSQQMLADRLEVRENQISRWENRKNRPIRKFRDRLRALAS